MAEAVRERILSRARAVVAMGGRRRRPTVADFAAAAEVSRASFYRHFKSRDELLDALAFAPEPGTRDRILEAAVALVGDRGLTGMSMDELADRAAVSRATLYRIFPGKASLLGALIEGYSPLEPVAHLLATRSDQPPDVLMPEVARTAYRAVAGRTGLMRALFFEVSGLAPETEEVAAQAITKVVGLLGMYVTGQMAAGRLRTMHPLLALQSFIAPIFFHILTRPIAERVLNLDIDGEQAVKELADAWLRAMAIGEEAA